MNPKNDNIDKEVHDSPLGVGFAHKDYKEEDDNVYQNSPIRIVCELCELEMNLSTKQNGIWVCPECDKKYPDVE